jgi:hypothetical protein
MPDDKKILDDAKKAYQNIKQAPQTLEEQLSMLDDTVKKNLPAQTLLSTYTVIEKDLKSYDSDSTVASKAATALKNVNSSEAKKLLGDIDKAVQALEKMLDKGRAKIKDAKATYAELVKSDSEEIELMKNLESLAGLADKAIAALKDIQKVLPSQADQLTKVQQQLGAQGLKAALPAFQKELIQRSQTIAKAISLGGELDAEIKKAKPYRLKGANDAMATLKKKKADLTSEGGPAQTAYNKALATFNTLSKQAA